MGCIEVCFIFASFHFISSIWRSDRQAWSLGHSAAAKICCHMKMSDDHRDETP